MTITLAITLGLAGAEYALGRWGGPRFRSTTQAIGTVLHTVAQPLIGKVPLAGPVVVGLLEAISPPAAPPCDACKGTGTQPKP